MMKHFLKNSIILTMYSFCAIPLGYIVRLFYANNLTIKEFGLFYSVINVFGAISVFNDFGFSETQAYFIPKYLAKGENEKVKSIIVVSFINQIISSLIVFLLFMLFSNTLAIRFFKIPEAVIFLKYMAVYFVLSDFLANISVLFYAYKEAHIYGSIESLRLLLTSVALGIFLPIFVTDRLIVISTIWIVIYAIITTYYTVLFLYMHRDIWRYRMHSLKETYKTSLYYAFPTALRSGANIILNNTAVMMLTFIKGVESVAMYNIAQPIAGILLIFISPISNLLAPITTEMDEKKNQSSIQKMLSSILNTGSFFLLPCISMLLIYAYEIIQILFGLRYVEASVSLKVFAICMFFVVMNEFIYGFVTGFGLPKEKMKIMYTASFLNLFLCTFFIPIFGVLGAVISTLLSQVFLFLVGLYLLHAKSVFSREQFSYYGRILLNLVIFITLQYSLIHGVEIENIYTRVIINSAISGAVYLILGLKVFHIIDTKPVFSYIRSKFTALSHLQ